MLLNIFILFVDKRGKTPHAWGKMPPGSDLPHTSGGDLPQMHIIFVMVLPRYLMSLFQNVSIRRRTQLPQQ